MEQVDDIVILMDTGELHLSTQEMRGNIPRKGDLIDGSFDDGSRLVGEVDEVIWRVPPKSKVTVFIATTNVRTYDEYTEE